MTAASNSDDDNMTNGRWGSDIIASALRDLGFPYVCLVPGASYRGIHDSLVNFLGNRDPEMLVCLHEEHSVAIAHGYAKVTGEPLAVALHSNVGLLHASMAIFNAWCDRIPVVTIGATGPLDAEKRRPWIDWIHTSIDQGAAVRDFVKWDDQPGSAVATVEALRRGKMIATHRPSGPVYINIDSAIQESPVTDAKIAPVEWFRPARMPAPPPDDLAQAKAMIDGAARPVILCGRVSRSEAGWQQRIDLAERIGTPVFSEFSSAGSFPRSHPLYAGTLRFTLKGNIPDALANADLVIFLDWTDAGGTLEQLWGRTAPRPAIINCSNDHEIHHGWNMDYQRLAAADLRVATTPESFVAGLLEIGLADNSGRQTPNGGSECKPGAPKASGTVLSLPEVADAYGRLTAPHEISLVSSPIGWPVATIKCDHPLDFLGSNGGGGLGAGPGIAIGAALAIRDTASGRITVAILGDGDFLMGVNALWTAAKHRIPVLIIVANNRSYFNDETHQELMAKVRHRPVENKWVGQRLDDPAPDIAGLARAQGVDAAGPVESMPGFEKALAEGLKAVASGKSFVIDVIVEAAYAN